MASDRVLTDYVYKALVFDVIIDGTLGNGGLGRSLVNAIVDHLLLKQVESIELYCRLEMMAFYAG